MEKQHVTSEYEKAIQYIYSLMQDGTLQNGSKLPTERTIAETLEIGRNSTAYRDREIIYQKMPESRSVRCL